MRVPDLFIVNENAINTTKLPLNRARRNIGFQVNHILDQFGYAVVSLGAWQLCSLGLLETALLVRLPVVAYGADWVLRQPLEDTLDSSILWAKFSLMIETLQCLPVHLLLLRSWPFDTMAQALLLQDKI